MPLDPEVVARVAHIEPPEGVTTEDWQYVVARGMYLIDEDEVPPEVVDRVFGADSGERMYEWGYAVGRVWERERFGLGADVEAEFARLPRIPDFVDRGPSVNRAHRDTQMSLLRAIQQAADGNRDPGDLLRLANAYLRLRPVGDIRSELLDEPDDPDSPA